MSLYPVGLLLVLSAFTVSIVHLNQSAKDYYDLVALMLVSFGTLAVFLVAMPWSLKQDLKIAFSRLIYKNSKTYKQVLQICMSFLKSEIRHDQPNEKQSLLFQKIISTGNELIDLGFSKEKIELILFEMTEQHVKRQLKVSNAVKGLAKYPPAFGLMGTVLGLVNVMNGVSQGSDGKSTALKMAIALIATMYGLVVSNAVIFPASEVIHKAALDDQALAEIAIQTVLLKVEQTSLLEAQEMLNALVPEDEKINFIQLESDAAA